MKELNIKAYVTYKDYQRYAEIHLVIDEPNGDMGIFEPVTLVCTRVTQKELNDGRKVEPFFSAQPEILNGIIKAFTKLAEERGIPTETEGACRVELKATKYHLEDVRKIAKLTDGSHE